MMKKLHRLVFCVAFIFCLTACKSVAESPGQTELQSASVARGDETTSESTQQVSEVNSADASENIESSEDYAMKLFVNDKEVPVTWENNAAVSELTEEAFQNEIIVSMSMYSDFEQVGSLGKKYSSSDKQITTANGDIVLYNSSNIVMFYGSNSWAYTRLGKMELSEQEVRDLLGNGDVTVRLGN